MDTSVWMAESLCCAPETITTLLTGYTPMQNKKYPKKNMIIDPGEALFCFVNGLAGYHSRGGSGITSLRPQSLALVSSV